MNKKSIIINKLKEIKAYKDVWSFYFKNNASLIVSIVACCAVIYSTYIQNNTLNATITFEERNQKYERYLRIQRAFAEQFSSISRCSSKNKASSTDVHLGYMMATYVEDNDLFRYLEDSNKDFLESYVRVCTNYDDESLSSIMLRIKEHERLQRNFSKTVVCRMTELLEIKSADNGCNKN